MNGFGGYQLKCELSTLSIIGHAVIWILLTIVTFGLALFVFPYYMQRFIINQTSVYNMGGQKVGRLLCEIDLVSMIGYIILWAILSFITFGILYFVFLYKIHAHCYSKTRMVPIGAVVA
ncbi:DUF6693 family protein [Oligella urethralis]|uniref:DUF6693 family protein n=1 Tax=Oligella urethralis TaxID=90245 RepID=UPI000E06C435|nr:DUF6693 family protein [Oligella urethralis]SUA58536.1 Uncharacterised protein [Oligella urethralis]